MRLHLRLARSTSRQRDRGRAPPGLLGIALAAIFAVLLHAAPAVAASGTWERAWGKDVNGGGVFGVCTVAVSCSAGTIGGLGGQLNSPGGVATDAAGNIYVADAVNNRIQKFDSSGTWLRAWGKNVNGGSGGFGICTVAASCQGGNVSTFQGALGGEMFIPQSVATDSSGNVYVADEQNNRIQKFDSSGNWLRAWGKNVIQSGHAGDLGTGFEVCTVAADCQAGANGGLGGEMFLPEGVATDSSGNVYVADPQDHRIQKFDSSGTWLRAWGKNVIQSGHAGDLGTGFEVCTVAADCQAGAVGTLGGEMSFPLGLATDSSGNVYSSDANLNRIQKFDSSGTWLRAWGKNVIQFGQPGDTGSGFEVCTVAADCQFDSGSALGGEMNTPFGLATDPSANVYVADRNNHRIQEYDSSGAWLRAWGKNVNGGGVFGVCTVAASCLAGDTGGLGGEMSLPVGVATDSSGNVDVADRDNNRIQKFDPDRPTISTQGTASVTLGGQISDQAILSGGSGPTGTITFTAYGPGDDTCANTPAYTSNAVTVAGDGDYGSSPAFTPSGAGTYRWRASYSGDVNNPAIATPCNDVSESSVVDPVTPTISSQATASAAFGSPITDQATLSSGHVPTGTITFTAYGPNDTTCANAPAYTSDGVVVAGNGTYANSPVFLASSLGTYRWRASYSGDVNNDPVETVCNEANEASLVTIATPTITTHATATATLGQQISDQATLSAGGAPTGTITFRAYGPDDANCTNAAIYTSNPITVLGNQNYVNSPSFVPAATGTYRWTVSYTGDSNNNSAGASCNDANETSLVSAASVPPVLTPSPTPTATGQRAAALKKCKKKKSAAARRSCKRRANQLPL